MTTFMLKYEQYDRYLNCSTQVSLQRGFPLTRSLNIVRAWLCEYSYCCTASPYLARPVTVTKTQEITTKTYTVEEL